MSRAIDFHENPAQAPAPSAGFHSGDPSFQDLNAAVKALERAGFRHEGRL
jgi:hypothetical protein